jgi:hypothetical protein
VTTLVTLGPEDDDLPAHSLLGASGAYRWLNCPGSFRLSRSAPARPASIYAATGTLAHRYIEEAITQTPPGTRWHVPDTEAGAQIQVERHVIEVDQDFIDGVNLMLDYIWDRSLQYSMFGAEFTVRLDSYFVQANIKPPTRLYGRTDLVMVDKPRRLLEVVDYKNGAGILVEVENNPQMLFYAAGVLAELGQKFSDLVIDTVKLTVVQPHARSVEKIRSWTVDALDVLLWVDEVLIPGVQRCAQPDAPLNPDPYWCQFCPASHTCPALIDKANQMAKHAFTDDQDDPLSTLPSSPEKLAEALDLADQAETWIKALRAYATEQLKAQVRIPNWGLVPTRPVRRWTELGVSQVETNLVTLGLAREGHRSELLTPAQMEKLARRKGHTWDAWFGPYVESHSSGVKLARTDRADAADFPEC